MVAATWEGSASPLGSRLVRRAFRELATRPMVDVAIDTDQLGSGELEDELQRRLEATDSNAIVRLRFEGAAAEEALRRLSTARLRELGGETRTVELSWRRATGGSTRGKNPDAPAADA